MQLFVPLFLSSQIRVCHIAFFLSVRQRSFQGISTNPYFLGCGINCPVMEAQVGQVIVVSWHLGCYTFK